jgi:hypothetical protein
MHGQRSRARTVPTGGSSPALCIRVAAALPSLLASIQADMRHLMPDMAVFAPLISRVMMLCVCSGAASACLCALPSSVVVSRTLLAAGALLTNGITMNIALFPLRYGCCLPCVCCLHVIWSQDLLCPRAVC